jgi:hypothetical protein
MTEPAPDALVSLRFAADAAGIGLPELRRLIASGRIGRKRINGMTYVNLPEVMNYVRSSLFNEQKTDGRG